MKKLLSVILSIFMLTPLAGCVDQNPQSHKSGDDRIVATSYATLQICDILGLDLVGIPKTSFEVPERYKGISEVGSAMGPDTEVIASLKPTDILGPDTLIDTIKPTYDALNLPATFLNLRSVEGLYDSIALLGEKYNKSDVSQKVISEYEQKISELNKMRGEKKAPKVLLLMGFPGSYCQATPSSYIGNLLELSGAENIVTDTDEDFVNINTEELISAEPDYILWTSHAMPEQVREMFEKEFAENDVWKNFTAVKEGRVIQLDEKLFSMSANFEWDKALEFLYETFYGE